MNRLILNSGKTEVMLVEKVEVLESILFPTFCRIHLTLAESVKSLRVILEKQPNSPAKKPIFFHLYSLWRVASYNERADQASRFMQQ